MWIAGTHLNEPLLAFLQIVREQETGSEAEPGHKQVAWIWDVEIQAGNETLA